MDPEITTLRLRVCENGYDPIPLRGKRPDMMKGWHWDQIGHATPDQISMWAKSFPDAVNTGITARNTCCLDLDVLNEDAAEAMEQHVRDKFSERGMILVRFGRYPKRAIPFRTSTPFKKIQQPLGRGEEKIEFLADGQQFAAFGIHPDTHGPYTWVADQSPLNTKRTALPEITEVEARALVAELGKIASDFDYEPEPKRHAGGNGGTWEPTDIEELTRRILAGEALHDSVLKIAGSYAARGAPKQDCIDYIGLAFTAARQPRYGGRWDECMKAIDYCYAKEKEKQAPPTPSIWITGEVLTNTQAPAQEWSVRDLIPAKQVCLFSGHGAVGKSSTALHLAAAHALKRAWLRFDPTPGPAFFIDAEDDLDVIHRRLDAILAHYEDGSADLADLHILSLAGKGAVMATANRSGIVEPTALYREIYQRAGDLKPQQIVIASSANVFAGSEMDRSQVTQFIDLLTKIAILTGGSVILISHPSLTGLNTNSGISGSTSWHNAVRARFYLKFITNGGDEQDSSDLRVLEFQKNQYGPPAQSLTLRFRNGLFLAETDGVSNLDKLAREAKAEQKFRDLLRRMIDGNRPVSAKPTARNYAPTAFAREPDPEGLDKRDFENAMKRLFAAKAIEVKQYGKPSLGWERIEFV